MSWVEGEDRLVDKEFIAEKKVELRVNITVNKMEVEFYEFIENEGRALGYDRIKKQGDRQTNNRAIEK